MAYTRHDPPPPRSTVVAALLVTAAPAHAKGVIKATVCGADGCRAVAVRSHDPALVEMGAETDGPTASGPGFVRLHITIGEGDDPAHGVKLTQLYVPARDLLAVREDGGGWVWTTPLPAGSQCAAAGGARRAHDPRAPPPRAALPTGRGRRRRAPPPSTPPARAADRRAGWWPAAPCSCVAAGFVARRRGRA